MPRSAETNETSLSHSQLDRLSARARRILRCLTPAQRRVLVAMPPAALARRDAIDAQPLTISKLREYGLVEVAIGGLRLTELGRRAQAAA